MKITGTNLDEINMIFENKTSIVKNETFYINKEQLLDVVILNNFLLISAKSIEEKQNIFIQLMAFESEL